MLTGPPITPSVRYECGVPGGYIAASRGSASLLTGVIVGLFPALQAARPNLTNSLKQGGHGGSAGAHSRVRNTLVVAEIALAFVLLTVAFRAALVPITSIVGFLLSVFAALGVQVAIFQWGWGAGFLGVTPGETISFLPIIVLAITVVAILGNYPVLGIDINVTGWTRI